MPARSQSSTVLLVLILLITFPIWFCAGAILFGVFIGLFGAAVGIIAAVAGAAIAVVALPFKLIFGGGHWGLIVALIIITALIVRRNQQVN